MQSQFRIISAVLLSLLVFAATPAQQGAAEAAAKLRDQLADVQTKQGELQTRMQELDEALKAENIESSLAGVGSTHPEELRAQRRRQLEKEKAGVNTQLEQLAISQRRLESAIAQADAAAYQQSARPNDSGTGITGPNTANVDDSSTKTKRTTRHRSRRAKPKKSSRQVS